MKLLKSLYVQVLIGIAAGVILGFVAPERGAAMRPLGDGFIKLVKMLIAPIVFSTVVVGIAHMGAMKEVGRIGVRALIYFEVVSTIALGWGMRSLLEYGERGLQYRHKQRWELTNHERYGNKTRGQTKDHHFRSAYPCDSDLRVLATQRGHPGRSAA